MSIISTIKDFFKKPEVSGVLLTCGCVVVGAVYDAIKAKTSTDTDNKKGDDNMANKELEKLMYDEAKDVLKDARALRSERLSDPDATVYTQAIGAIITIVGPVIGMAGQIMGIVKHSINVTKEATK